MGIIYSLLAGESSSGSGKASLRLLRTGQGFRVCCHTWRVRRNEGLGFRI